jgi:phage tail sheath protein FI
MPSALTYPGVYIEEIPSGVRTITGVATSIAAFVGRTLRGPVDDPVLVTSYGDFERQFGGLWSESTLSYAVRDFFRNGGAQAVIVRGFSPALPVPGAPGTPPAPAAVPATATRPASTVPAATATTAPTAPTASPGSDRSAVVIADSTYLTLKAASPGSWGNRLRSRIVTAASEVDDRDPTAFNLSLALVRHDATGKATEVAELEVFRNVSLMSGHPRQIDKVLAAESKLAVASGFSPQTGSTPILPTPNADPAAANPGSPGSATGVVPVVAPVAAVAAISIWDNNNTSTGVSTPGDDGNALNQTALTGGSTASNKTGLYALDKADLFNLLCVTPHAPGGDIENALIDDAIAYCTRRRAVMLIDPPNAWRTRAQAVAGVNATPAVIGTASRNAALFFPRLVEPDPLKGNLLTELVPCGAIAGVMARTDVERGVWKAPAGLAASLVGVPDLSVHLDEGDIGQLNPLGVNCLRTMPDVGRVIWGSRTREGSDRLASEWKYLPVRRLTLFIEESLYRGTHWVVFEPNDEPLWSSIRLNVGAFMHSLFRQGAFQGKTAREAYEVKCDSETTTQDDINRGVVNIVVRFAPLKPAEFVVIKIQQLAGQVQA